MLFPIVLLLVVNIGVSAPAWTLSAGCTMLKHNTGEELGEVKFMTALLYNKYSVNGFEARIQMQSGDRKTFKKHGFHVHTKAVSGLDCSSTGDHYNPFHEEHGDRSSDERHIGDFGNLQEYVNGVMSTTYKINNYKNVHGQEMFSLEGETSLIGRSIVLNRDEDDLTQEGDEQGNAGDRIACCTIKKL